MIDDRQLAFSGLALGREEVELRLRCDFDRRHDPLQDTDSLRRHIPRELDPDRFTDHAEIGRLVEPHCERPSERGGTTESACVIIPELAITCFTTRVSLVLFGTMNVWSNGLPCTTASISEPLRVASGPRS